MQLVIQPDGTVRCVYGETINLAVIGRLTISRSSHVEPDAHGRWLADLSPAQGPWLGPFDCRSEALKAEQDWLTANWLAARG
jgi:hypothetical protein